MVRVGTGNPGTDAGSGARRQQDAESGRAHEGGGVMRGARWGTAEGRSVK